MVSAVDVGGTRGSEFCIFIYVLSINWTWYSLDVAAE